jgi:murein DD-endopeptidase MepM/ murein hydrolase activator NlpD
MHLSKRAVTVGTKVQKGQYIGLVGSTGRSTGAHLHFEILVRRVQVNPLTYMNDSRKDESNVGKQED